MMTASKVSPSVEAKRAWCSNARRDVIHATSSPVLALSLVISFTMQKQSPPSARRSCPCTNIQMAFRSYGNRTSPSHGVGRTEKAAGSTTVRAFRTPSMWPVRLVMSCSSPRVRRMPTTSIVWALMPPAAQMVQAPASGGKNTLSSYKAAPCLSSPTTTPLVRLTPRRPPPRCMVSPIMSSFATSQPSGRRFRSMEIFPILSLILVVKKPVRR